MVHNENRKVIQKEVLRFPEVAKGSLSFNHVIKVGNTLYLTSQLSCNLRTGQIIHGSIEEQTRNALENLKFLLERSNSCLENIVKATIYMRNIDDFAIMESVYRKYFIRGEEPARVTVQAMSPIEGVDIEIEAIAFTNE